MPTPTIRSSCAQVIDYYYATSKGSNEALDYFKKKGITNGKAITKFRIGYSDRTLGLKLPTHHVKAGRLIRERLQQIGLYRASGHEHFAGCITFPIKAADGTGQIVDPVWQKGAGQQAAEGYAPGHVPDQ